jgi:BMFP domain-containing protein YqiC
VAEENAALKERIKELEAQLASQPMVKKSRKRAKDMEARQ